MTVRGCQEVTKTPVGGVRSFNYLHYFHGWMFSNLEAHEENRSFACAGQMLCPVSTVQALVCFKGLQSLLGLSPFTTSAVAQENPTKSTGSIIFEGAV